ncbi:MAG: OsmC family peroxiredoxin [Cytophagales bacterium]|nr:OsmC family peroxiredoxin [Cytophagales bacterium]
MQIKRTATAVWHGTGKEGAGKVSTQSGVLNHNQYSFNTRFADGKGTNPEELVGAAHAACFSMKLAFVLQEMSFIPESIDTIATVILESGNIGEIMLNTSIKANGLTTDKMNEAVNNAKENCPISKLFKANITVSATLL